MYVIENSEKVLDAKFWKKKNQFVVSRSCLILTDYKKGSCVDINRLQNKNGNLGTHSTNILEDLQPFQTLFLVQGQKQKEMNRKGSGFHIYPV